MMDYLDYAKAQGLDVHSITGVIIYPDNDDVPQDIILIPYEASPGQNLAEIIMCAIAQDSVTAIFNYFQNIRWIMPNLEEELRDWTFRKGQSLDSAYFNGSLRLSYGKITFDRSMANFTEEEDANGELKLLYDDKVYIIPVAEFPKNVGPAKLFEKINL